MPANQAHAASCPGADGSAFTVHSHAAAKRRRRAPRPASGPVTVTRPNPDAWRAALAAAGGDPRRIKVISPTEIIIK